MKPFLHEIGPEATNSHLECLSPRPGEVVASRKVLMRVCLKVWDGQRRTKVSHQGKVAFELYYLGKARIALCASGGKVACKIHSKIKIKHHSWQHNHVSTASTSQVAGLAPGRDRKEVARVLTTATGGH